ncbi:MAG: O-methyltransferase [Bernardetiaceae bacterium]
MDWKSVYAYADAHSHPESPLRARVRRQTHLEVCKPRMLSGVLQTNLLQMIVRMLQPRLILEVGTFTGYTTLALAEAMPAQAQLHTIERNEELRKRVQKHIGQSPHADRIFTHWGMAQTLIADLPTTFDLVFLDADKTAYPDYYRQLMPRIRPGGWLVADNVLWSGKVVQAAAHTDKKTQAIAAFNQLVHQDTQKGFHVLLPIRDGLLIIQKK